jgi:hypothetical protein
MGLVAFLDYYFPPVWLTRSFFFSVVVVVVDDDDACFVTLAA